jgi:hypothetical protein
MGDRSYLSNGAVAEDEEPPDSSEFKLDRQYYLPKGMRDPCEGEIMFEGRVLVGDGNGARREI